MKKVKQNTKEKQTMENRTDDIYQDTPALTLEELELIQFFQQLKYEVYA